MGPLRLPAMTRRRTNLALQSQTFTSGTWLKDTGVTVGATNFSAPDGSAAASEVTYAGGAAGFAIYQRPTIVSATQYTQSIWAKSAPGADQSFRLIYDNASRTGNLTATSAWQRFTITFNSTVTSPFLGVDGAGSYDLLLWGAQLELGGAATGYIPTTSTTAQRFD